ncbi:hypothetical protein EDEG_05093 [Edhazardia aedis USNM 41457]|uniref:Elongator complex protein 2 n=1 Tax=Edhazardia aedis (strain USNM 41457) TaxID=1003232 RepID=A0A0L1P7A8_EDHAE|nr:hypothetical protein EDEG_05093 [Edhazardia aedis USNM 41457]|eukprot:KNH48524.1 hypothetical protein EDEG_05093 [Edhazardia aedis USNM 41457]
MKRVFSYAGASRRPNISCCNEDFLFYGSKENIIVADQQKIVEVLCRDGGLITYLDISDGYLMVGDASGIVEVFKIKFDRDSKTFSAEKIFKQKFDFAITSFHKLNTSKTVLYIVSGIFEMILVENTKVLEKVQFDFPISYCTVINFNEKNSIFVCFDNGSIEIFDFFDTLKRACKLQIHKNSIKSCKYRIIDKQVYLLTSSLDKSIIVSIYNQELSRLETKQELFGHRDWIFTCNWTKNNDILSGSADNNIILWKKRFGGIIEKNQTFYNAMLFHDYIIAQSISGGFYKYIKNADNSYQLVSYLSGHCDDITSLDIQGDKLLSTSLDSTTRIFSFYLNEEVTRPQTHGYQISAARFLNENWNIISGAQETILRLYSPTRIVQENYRNKIFSKINCIQSKNERCSDLLILSEMQKNDETINTNNKHNLFAEEMKSSIKKIYSDENLKNLPKMARTSELNLSNEIFEDNFCEILNEGNNERNLSLNFLFFESKKIYGHYFAIQDIAVSKKLVLTCNAASSKKYAGIFVWDHSFKQLQYLESHNLGINRIKFSQDQKLAISCSRDQTVCIYNVNDDGIKPVKVFTEHKKGVWDCDISFNNLYIASCSRDKTLIIYKMDDFSILTTKKFDCEVTSICFSKINNNIFVGLQNGFIFSFRIYNSDLECLHSFQAHSGPIKVLENRLDGKYLSSGGSDGLINVYSI